VPGPAIGSRAAMPPVGGQQALQQVAAKLGQPGAQRQFRRFQAAAASQVTGCRRSQPPYLGGSVGGERPAEPFFCPSGSGAWPAVAAGIGRASQIASLTSAICAVSCANS
jgi:hypothetical protein